MRYLTLVVTTDDTSEDNGGLQTIADNIVNDLTTYFTRLPGEDLGDGGYSGPFVTAITALGDDHRVLASWDETEDSNDV